MLKEVQWANKTKIDRWTCAKSFAIFVRDVAKIVIQLCGHFSQNLNNKKTGKSSTFFLYIKNRDYFSAAL